MRAGRGGSGSASFRREPFVPRGGPDGGDGGRGGSVHLVATPGLSSLAPYVSRSLWKAGDGAPGAGGRKHGRAGQDLTLEMPVGTALLDVEGTLVADLDHVGASFTAARGGQGGRGNVHFKTPSRQAPRLAEPGLPGEERELRLELRLIADLGLVGPPNAGKSSLLRALTAARPKVAAYPFTTLVPELGVAETAGGVRVVVADVPGLLEGASRGVGLGLQFLRHLERTRALVYVVDGAAPDPEADLDAVRREVAGYSAALAGRPSLTVVNKLDLAAARRLRARLRPPGVVFVSALTGEGLPELMAALEPLVEQAPRRPAAPAPVIRLRARRGVSEPLRVEPAGDGFRLSGGQVERLVRRAELGSPAGLEWFQAQLERQGVNAALEAAGVKPGDTVRIGEHEFEYQP